MTDAEAGNIGRLLAELSAEMAHMREAHAVDVARAAAEERAAVVAWLRKEAVSHRRDGFPIAAYTMQERADAIERGEHRREEER